MQRMKHLFNKFPIRIGLREKALVIFMLLVILPALTVGYIFHFYYEDILHEQFVDTTIRNMDSVVSQLEEQASIVEDIANYLILSPDLNEYLNPNLSASDERIHSLKRSVEDLLIFHLFSKDYIRSISIYGFNGNDIELGEPIIANEEKWWEEAALRKGGIVWSEGYPVYSYWEGDTRVISLFRILNSFSTIYLPQGQLVIRLDERNIQKSLENALYKGAGYIFVLDDDGNPILQSDVPLLASFDAKEALGRFSGQKTRYCRMHVENTEYLVFHQTMEHTNWDIFALIPASIMAEETAQVSRYVIIVLGAMLTFSFIALFGFQYMIIRPILRLKDETNRVKQGDFTAQVPIHSNDEISDLNRNFNEMVSTIRDLIDTKYKLELRERESELKLLQDQMDPHFLYNTLDMIRWTARLEKAEKTSQLIEILSKFLRNSQNNQQYVTTIQKELDFVQSYLFLQKKRLGNKLRYSIYTEADLADASILKSTIQPLVENFLKHGFDRKSPVNLITIKCYAAGEDIWIDVEDNGRGIEPQRLEQLRASLQDKHSVSERGGALLNIHERLSIYFGEGYGLQIVSSSGEGTLVRLRIPNTGNNGGETHDEPQ